jgi:hypothetical protein
MHVHIIYHTVTPKTRQNATTENSDNSEDEGEKLQTVQLHHQPASGKFSKDPNRLGIIIQIPVTTIISLNITYTTA